LPAASVLRLRTRCSPGHCVAAWTAEAIKLSRGLQQNFDHPASDIERQIKADIDAHRARRVSEWEKDLFVQKMRLADAER
jgi:hypothetical protein